jgi:hypothetical protein
MRTATGSKILRRIREMDEYHECGCCSHYHRAEYAGDCRNDTERFTYEDLTRLGVSAEQIIGLDDDVLC